LLSRAESVLLECRSTNCWVYELYFYRINQPTGYPSP
jgi:hypothetical protein